MHLVVMLVLPCMLNPDCDVTPLSPTRHKHLYLSSHDQPDAYWSSHEIDQQGESYWSNLNKPQSAARHRKPENIQNRSPSFGL